MFAIRPECAADSPAIEALLDRCFGLDRLEKVSYRYRDGVPPLARLCFVAEAEEKAIVGAIRYWPARLDEQPALLLGPLAIAPDRQGRGVGRALVFHSLERAAMDGHRLVFLVGDPPYYARFGFAVAPPGIVMPGELPSRLNVRVLDATLALPRHGTLHPAAGHPSIGAPPATAPALKAIATASGIP